MKKTILFFTSLIFFSFLIFFIGNYFFWWFNNNKLIEEKYIDPVSNIDQLDDYDNLIQESDKNTEIILKSAYNIDFKYFPVNLEKIAQPYTNTFNTILNSKIFSNKIEKITIEFYKDKSDVRWKMKDRKLKLFWIDEIKLDECSSVWIHEFAHYIDLYFFKKSVFTDISNYFYNISWENTTVIKAWLEQKDFVSWYSMTNKYEDFAESFTYFILHNWDFLEKSKKSVILKNKYDFFSKFLFKNNEFIWTNFWLTNEIQDYYRDITKINFSLENFLEFLKK